MGENRVFTEEELKEMGASPMDAAIEAVRAGDKEKAENSIRALANSAQQVHDMYAGWIADLMDYIYVNDGEEALYQALRKSLGHVVELTAEVTSMIDFRERIQMVASMLHGHLHGPLEIEEDDEKVSLKMVPCGSGQFLVESGAYEPPRNLSRMKAHRMTWGMSNFPIYCAHAPVAEILGIEKQGYPVYMNFPAEEMAKESCRFVIYKDPKTIPDEVYKRVGMEKPK